MKSTSAVYRTPTSLESITVLANYDTKELIPAMAPFTLVWLP